MKVPDSRSGPTPVAEPKVSLQRGRVLRRQPFWQLLVVTFCLVTGGKWLLAQGVPGPQPSFGTLTASPKNFVFGNSTIVTFTIRIDTPTINPTTVELRRVDAQGTLQGIVGRMSDNGKNGDLKAGDRIFTLGVTLNEPTVGRNYYRVSAAFRGNTLNAESKSAFVDIDPFPLPPDPGDAGKQTVQGIDSDHDGVRDDVQRWIGIKHQTDSQAVLTLNRYAEVSQEVILAADKLTVMPLMQEHSRAAACWDRQYPTDNRVTLRQLREQFVNTDERFKAYMDSQRLVSGETFRTFVGDPSVCEP